MKVRFPRYSEYEKFDSTYFWKKSNDKSARED